MKKAVKVLAVYLSGLLVFSLIFSWLGITNFNTTLLHNTISIQPLMFLTIAGGIWALWVTVTPGAFKIFILIYCLLWIVRFFILYLASHFAVINLFNHSLNFYIIVNNYYAQVSRLATPLPFVIFWLVNHYFSNMAGKKKGH